MSEFNQHSAVIRVPRLVETEPVRVNVSSIPQPPGAPRTDWFALAVDICKPDPRLTASSDRPGANTGD